MRGWGEHSEEQMESNNFYPERPKDERRSQFFLPTIKLKNSLSVEKKSEYKISGVELAQNKNLLAELDDQQLRDFACFLYETSGLDKNK
jgi:hypothetical protein